MKHAEAAQLVMAPIIEAVIPHFAPKVWEDMSAQFCTTFWSLTMYDLYVPEHLYEKEIKKLKEAPAKLIENKDLNSARRKKEAERLNTLMERLQVRIYNILSRIIRHKIFISSPIMEPFPSTWDRHLLQRAAQGLDGQSVDG